MSFVHITLYTMRLKSSLLKSLPFVPPRPSLFLILVVELVRLCMNSGGTQDSSLCREFLDDAMLALHDYREGKKEVVIESGGSPGGSVCPDHLDWFCTVSDEAESNI